ncbi:hypothetical protein MN608_11488 [Microdochium nivale]|nr:hypothetical protein MN608_11488 [Microdochium nivale]
MAPPTPQEQAQSFQFGRLPAELRVKVYKQYMRDYLLASHDGAIIFAPWSSTTLVITSNPAHTDPECRIYTFESDRSEMPPLMQTCKTVARELAPVASRAVRIVLGTYRNILTRGDPRPLSRHAHLSLPPRCRPAAAVTELHLEWRAAATRTQVVMMSQQTLRALGCDTKIHDLILCEGMVNISKFRFTFRADTDIMQAYNNAERDVLMRDRIEPVLSTLVAVMNYCRRLETVELVGIFRKTWVDALVVQAQARGATVVRGRAHHAAPGFEVCG